MVTHNYLSMYDKPKVTIDLDEYLYLKKKEVENTSLDNLAAGMEIHYSDFTRNLIGVPLQVKNVEVTDTSKTYTFSNYTGIYFSLTLQAKGI